MKSEKNAQMKDSVRNPYLDARTEWLERYGGYISRAAHWRLMAILGLGIAILSMTGNVVQLTQHKVVPYVVETDTMGNIKAARKADHGTETPERVIQSEVAKTIINWRTVTVDTDLQRRMIADLSAHSAGATKGTLKTWYETNSPYEIAKSGKLVQVEIKGLPLPVSKNSYRVEWAEIIRSHQGVEMDRQQYEAIATVEIIPPETEDVILRNPGGVYISNLSAAKIIK